MRKIVGWMICLVIILAGQGAPADVAAAPLAAKKTGQETTMIVETPVVKNERSAPIALASGIGTVTDVRWAVHNDPVVGSCLRIVFDVSNPVQVETSVVSQPSNRLVVKVKGVLPGQNRGDINFDGKYVESVSYTARGDNATEIILEVPELPQDGSYKVFTMAQDPANNKPHRVIVDVGRPTPAVTYNFKQGLKGKVIAIDPGHGGSDPGAIGPSRVYEKNVTLAVALKTKAILENAGAKVIMTRQDDRDVFGPNASDIQELQARCQVANGGKADVFVSIHANSFSDSTIDGAATYYNLKSRYDSMLAESLQTSIISSVTLRNKGTYSSNFYVVRRTMMPAALVEMAFISNPREEKMLSSPDFQLKMAQSIVQGLDRFFSMAAKAGGGKG